MNRIQQKKDTLFNLAQLSNVLEGPTKHLAIIGEANVKFSLNGGNTITIGQYGIYEIDLTNTEGTIYSLTFDASGTENCTLIIDSIYMEDDGK